MPKILSQNAILDNYLRISAYQLPVNYVGSPTNLAQGKVCVRSWRILCVQVHALKRESGAVSVAIVRGA